MQSPTKKIFTYFQQLKLNKEHQFDQLLSAKIIKIDPTDIKINNSKTKLIKAEIQDNIQKQNLCLYKKINQIDQKRKKHKESFHIDSLNIKNRKETNKKIQTENMNLIKRLKDQKSRYPTELYQEEYKKTSSFSKSIRKSHHNRLNTDICQSKNTMSTFEVVTYTNDGFPSRNIIYTKMICIKKKQIHLEISKTRKFYYILLNQVANKKFYKLRLINKTGSHLLNLINRGSINLQERITHKTNNYYLTIPFFPFARNFTFWEYQKNQKIKTQKTQKTQKNQKTQKKKKKIKQRLMTEKGTEESQYKKYYEEQDIEFRNKPSRSEKNKSQININRQDQYKKSENSLHDERLDAEPSLTQTSQSHIEYNLNDLN